ncbi:MAG: hypothetical protein WA414_17325 [Acidobacteriaceae bacterium]|jgi:hypothetical protein
MRKTLLAMGCVLVAAIPAFADQPSVQVLPPDLHGSRPLEAQTATAVVRDYLESWQKFSAALDANQSDLLDPDFVGTAREKLAATIATQAKIGIRTHYQDLSHNLQIVFYSPEGQSLEMLDTVEYDVQIFDHDKQVATQHVKARYVVVMTPAEVRWKVRVFQAEPKS